jgi:hypothetical protein
MGTTHNGSPSLRAILEDSTDEFYITSSGEESIGFSITTTPRPEDALTPQTIATIPLQTIAPRLDTRFPHE